MAVTTRAKGNTPQLALIGLLLVIVLYAPAAVATSVTASSEPVNFLARPWAGWTFAGTVLVDSMSAEAASPGSALARANQAFGIEPGTETEGEPAPTSVELLYVPNGEKVSVRALTPAGEERRTLEPKPRLVWQVLGRYGTSTAEGVIGLIDFDSGDLIWDVRSEVGNP